MKISYGKNVYGKDEIKAVVDKLKVSTQMGVDVDSFEKKIAKFFGKKYGLMVNSGSSALTLAINVLGFKKGDEIITPCLNFGTAVSSIALAGAKPIFVDIEIDTLQINTKKIIPKINSKTKGIVVPNLIGNIPDWKEIKKIAKKYNLKIIEDSADTLGASIGNKPTGIFSDISITSFYGSHIINCAGNGGALTVNKKDFYESAKLLRSWGRSSSLYDEKSEAIENRFNVNLDGLDYDAKFVFEKIGYNLEGSEIGAAFGLAQLKNLSNNISIRQGNFLKQIKFFSQFPDIFINPQENKNVDTAWLAFPILISENAKFSRREFQIFLEEREIQTRVVFTGNILKQPLSKFINKKVVSKDGYPNADAIMKRGVLLPLHHGMTEKMFKKLHSTIQEFISNY